jgi:hypothetical protein
MSKNLHLSSAPSVKQIPKRPCMALRFATYLLINTFSLFVNCTPVSAWLQIATCFSMLKVPATGIHAYCWVWSTTFIHPSHKTLSTANNDHLTMSIMWQHSLNKTNEPKLKIYKMSCNLHKEMHNQGPKAVHSRSTENHLMFHGDFCITAHFIAQITNPIQVLRLTNTANAQK